MSQSAGPALRHKRAIGPHEASLRRGVLRWRDGFGRQSIGRERLIRVCVRMRRRIGRRRRVVRLRQSGVERARPRVQCDRLVSTTACLRDIHLFVNRRRLGQAIGRVRLRPDIRMRLADAARPGRHIAAHREIEMKVIVMQEVVSRPEDGGEITAGAVVDIAQKGLCLRIAHRPIMHDQNIATILQPEAAHVDRIAEGMFG